MPCPPHCAPLVPWPALGRAAQGSRLVLLTQLRGCALGARGVRRPTRAARFLVRVWGNLTREPLKMEHARQAAQWTCGAAHDFAVGRRPSSPSSSSRGAKAGGDADDALCPADPACFAPACSPCPSPTGSAPRDTAASWCESASSSRVSDFHHWTKASLCVRFGAKHGRRQREVGLATSVAEVCERLPGPPPCRRLAWTCAVCKWGQLRSECDAHAQELGGLPHVC
jgi:hypothetical protein